MAVTRAKLFLEAKKVLRAHRDWSDEQVAEAAGIKAVEIPDIIPAARRELEQDGWR